MRLLKKFQRPNNSTSNQAQNPTADELFEMGKRYEEQDAKESFQYFLQAAQMGHINAMRKVGYCYLYQGRGVDFDLENSFYWFEKGAKREDAGCMFVLSMFYMSGVGAPQSDDIAKELLQKMIQHGDEKEAAMAQKRLLNYDEQKILISVLMETAEASGGIPKKV